MSAMESGLTKPQEGFEDRFDDDRPPGKVIGTPATSGALRIGVDAEDLMSIDHGALRMRPLAKPGWAREGISYGPFRRKAGLAFAAHILNGHNASQTYYQKQGRAARTREWLADARRGQFRRPHHYENLAVGLFPSAAPADPSRSGNGFVMHAATADNGELWATVDGKPLRIGRGIQNLQILYVVILRDRGAAYYTASLGEAVGLGAYPSMQPTAIDHRSHNEEVFAGIHQRILGEVGYRVDTRVFGARVEELTELTAWYGTAALADRLTGSGPLRDRAADTGGSWMPLGGELVRTAQGVRSGSQSGEALLDADVNVGLVHVIVEVGRAGGSAGIVWRARPDDAEGAWSFTVGDGGVELLRRYGGRWDVVETSDRWRATRGNEHAVQVLDDGTRIGLYLDGLLVFDRWITGADAEGPTGVGVRAAGDATLRAFEAHPREIPIPHQLDLGSPWTPEPSREVFFERFQHQSPDLDGVLVAGSSTKRWSRVVGSGVIEATGDLARVSADRERPNPGRTVYTVPWDSPRLADLRLEMIPPGTSAKDGHAGRGGVVFWQNPDNYLVVNIFLDDTFDGASISSFYHLNGQEEMYDAVWTLVRGVTGGERCTLRVIFDGTRFLAYLNDEPCLYRALTDVYPHTEPLTIEQVGIIVNWEWGDDTGTTFLGLEARGSEPRQPSPG